LAPLRREAARLASVVALPPAAPTQAGQISSTLWIPGVWSFKTICVSRVLLSCATAVCAW
jgi:hypothetical protein